MNESKLRNNNITGAAADSQGGESIIICIDSTLIPEYFDAQLKAIRSYANFKIKSHLRGNLKLILRPTRDLRDLCKIFDSFQHIFRGGEVDIVGSLTDCMVMFDWHLPESIQKRIVMFAGGDVNIPLQEIHKFGYWLKGSGVALDVVNFTLWDGLNFRKEKLEAFVAAANNNDNSHIIHVEDGSSLSNLLSSFMAGDKHVEAKGLKNKDHRLIPSNTSSKKKETENRNVVNQPSSSGMKNKDHQFNSENQNVIVFKQKSEPSSKGARRKRKRKR